MEPYTCPLYSFHVKFKTYACITQDKTALGKELFVCVDGKGKTIVLRLKIMFTYNLMKQKIKEDYNTNASHITEEKIHVTLATPKRKILYSYVS